jgi:hypothetical protein
MLSLELCKRLKEAGFSQNKNTSAITYFWIKEGQYGYLNYHDKKIEGGIKIPSLEDLIDACGNELWSLTRHGNIWQTNFKNGMAGETAGKTPRDAVAELWIKRHK